MTAVGRLRERAPNGFRTRARFALGCQVVDLHQQLVIDSRHTSSIALRVATAAIITVDSVAAMGWLWRPRMLGLRPLSTLHGEFAAHPAADSLLAEAEEELARRERTADAKFCSKNAQTDTR